MWEWILSLLDGTGFMPRWSCGTWPEWLGWLHVASDLTTFAAYTAIPVVLGSLLLRRRDLPFPRVFVLFAAFIFACGAVHCVDAVIFWHPVYRLSGVLKGIMAVVSVLTLIALVPAMRRVLELPGFQRDTARLATIVSSSADAIITKDFDNIVDSWNAAAERMYGWTADEMIGQSIERIVPPDRRDELRAIAARARAGQRVGPIETERVTKDGTRIPISLSLSPVFGPAGERIGISAIARDIREQKRYEREMEAQAVRLQRANRRLRELADRDPLTGLLNRRGLEAELRLEIERIRRHGGRSAVVLVDLDDFKQTNERHGHQVGDQVLREIGDRIEDAARETDRVARIGGDEFLVLAVGARTSEAFALADRIRSAVASEPVSTSVGPVAARVSCGVEPVDPRQMDIETLLGESSSALRLAKATGKNAVATGELHAAASRAPNADELRAMAQPIVEVETGEVVAHELLVRGPKGPLESPENLFRAHRATDTLMATDLACLERCLSGALSLPAEQRAHVNVLPSTLVTAGLDPIVDRLRCMQGRKLCLELNEAMLVGDPAELQPHVQAIRRLTGCLFAIDDVGYGRSSLEALIVLEPDIVKIDRHYVSGVAGDPAARRKLERLVHVARALEAEIIAEGVEHERDREALRRLGIRFAQGYLFGRPANVN